MNLCTIIRFYETSEILEAKDKLAFTLTSAKCKGTQIMQDHVKITQNCEKEPKFLLSLTPQNDERQ